jgi:site-specific recombinase XerD
VVFLRRFAPFLYVLNNSVSINFANKLKQSFMNTSKEKLKVSFYLKKSIVHGGLCPVMGRIRIGRDMVRFSCKLHADLKLWDAYSGRLAGKSNHAQKINSAIDKINVAINAKFREIISAKGQITAVELKNAIQGITSSQETLLSVFREHNDEYQKRTGINCALSTWRNYDNARAHLERFIYQKYHVSDIHFKQLDYSFIENYEYYLRIDLKMKPGTILHKTSHLRKMVRIAIGRGIINRDPFSGYSPERPKTTPKYVPADELEKIIHTCLISPAQEVTRDLFIFCCFTGLAYVDLYNLTNEHIVKMDDDAQWLNINRQKTGSGSKIPLLEVPLQIIEKYSGTTSGDKIFPMKSAPLMNLQLKKVAQHCGIGRLLTFHMARHTFATEICLSQGVPIETVSRMMGHNKLSTTQIYAKITHNKVEEDMNALSEKIDDKYIFDI